VTCPCDSPVGLGYNADEIPRLASKIREIYLAQPELECGKISENSVFELEAVSREARNSLA